MKLAKSILKHSKLPFLGNFLIYETDLKNTKEANLNFKYVMVLTTSCKCPLRRVETKFEITK